MELPEKVLKPGAVVRPLTSLRLNATDAVLSFLHPRYLIEFVVSGSKLEAFSYEGKKILEARLKVKWSTEPEQIDEENRLPFVHVGGEGNPQVVLALCAAYVESLNEIAVGHSDNTVRFYSLTTGRMGTFMRHVPCQSAAQSMTVLGANKLILGCADGKVRLLRLDEDGERILSRSSHQVPHIFAAKVVRVWASSRAGGEQCRIFVAYDNGHAASLSYKSLEASEQVNVQVAAHHEKATGVVSVYNGDYFVTCGEDRSVAVFDADSGRCLARIKRDYDIATLYSSSVDPNRNFGGGETTVVVGGKHGQIDVFSIVIRAANFAEIVPLLSLSVGSHSTWLGQRRLTCIATSAVDGVLSAITDDGHFHHWLLDLSTSALLAFTEDAASESMATLVDLMEHNNVSACRLAAMTPVIQAQETLQLVLEQSVGLPEKEKDDLVNKFQKCQELQQTRVVELEKELETRRLVILTSFPDGVNSADESGTEDLKVSNAHRLYKGEKLRSILLDHQRAVYAIAQDLHSDLGKLMSIALRRASGEADSVKAAKAAVADMLKHWGDNLKGLTRSESV
mmetsp:Transcript_353/g.1186  ORF Transcript_353/g.1186 Transcript_353/m.1186 type:complete len:566 (+) Transcript_353:42-1739(+)